MSSHAIQGDAARSVVGRAIIVTGGTTGIGLAVARLLVARGARVLILGRHEPELAAALDELKADARAAGGEVHGLCADVSRVEDVRRVFAEADRRFGKLDVLVNNAAVSGETFAGQGLDDIEYMVRTNVVGQLACAHEAAARMRGRGGHIVNVGSMSADLREEGTSTYVATKAAIQAFSESLRKTVNEDGIKVTLIEPGKVATDMVGDSPEEKRAKQDRLEMLAPEDVAECVHYCLAQPARCDVVAVQLRPHRQII